MRARAQGNAVLSNGASTGPSQALAAMRAGAGAGDPVDGGLRRAALTLHAMQFTDREWLLGKLSDSEQEALRSLLAELAELGIPLQPRFVADVVKHVASDAEVAEVVGKVAVRDLVKKPGKDARPVEALLPRIAGTPGATHDAEGLSEAVLVLNQVEPQWMIRLLRLEPPLLVARVLALHPWTWRTALLDASGVLRRRRIEEFGVSLAPSPPALANALVSLLCERVRKLQGHVQHVPDHGAGAPHSSPAHRSALLQAWWQAGARCWQGALHAMRGRA